MTQQPYYPPMPQQPGYPAPQQPYVQPGYPPQQYAPTGYPPQGFPQQVQQPQQPAAPVVAGTMADFYSQPTPSGGPAISWKGKPDGTAYAGVISGKCVVQQDTDYETRQLKFQKDGVTPKWVMIVPLKQVVTNYPGPSEFPDGEAAFYVRGVAKDELARAMAEANCSGEPREGGSFQVTLTHRKPNRQGSPTNMFAIQYVPPGGVPHQDESAAAAPAPAPVQQESAPQQAAIQPQAPAGLPPMGAPQQEAPQQAPAPLAPLGAQVGQMQQGQPAQQLNPQGAAPQWAQPQQAQAPAQPVQQQLAPQPPPGLDATQAALLSQLGAGQPQG